MRTGYEVGNLLQRHWIKVEHQLKVNSWQLRTLSAVRHCRTAALGGHKSVCTDCGIESISYNSCRNRHCPKCQGRQREAWLEKRRTELLPVKYFHVVFTLPDTFNQLALYKPKDVYDALFEASWQTIDAFAKDQKHLGAKTGMISILHTWGQQLSLHPHLHCVIPQGGLTKNNQWKYAKSKGKYLFPVKAMSKVFRAKYLAIIRNKIKDIDKNILNTAYKKDWVVYAKRPFGNAESVMEYIGRYTHKIAISNRRITNIDENTITFEYKDYKDEAKKKELTLDALEFIRRFAMHILPKNFVRIRHYGILSSTTKKTSIPIIKELFNESKPLEKSDARQLQNYQPLYCVHCKKESMVIVEVIPKRGPPNAMKVNRDLLKYCF